MKYSFVFIFIFLAGCAGINKQVIDQEKIYVVERERESLFVLQSDNEKTIDDLGNLNHATMKFKNNYGYVLARDGFISKIDVETNKLIKKVKVGKSGIGITFISKYIAIVNYDPNSVVILDQDLNIVQTINTNSRNVGVKTYKNLLVFSLMDSNQIWVLDSNRKFEVVKKFENVGNLPFDALVKDNKYVVGFFNEAAVGILDIDKLEYKKIELKDRENNLVYKVPHFGYWGVVENKAIVPIVADKKLLVIDLDSMSPIDEIKLKGNPVFAAMSPDKKELVVNYSGDYENYISFINLSNFQVKKELEVGRRVMHLRYSLNSEKLYVSTYFDNSLRVFSTSDNKLLNTYKVATPSGIFSSELRE